MGVNRVSPRNDDRVAVRRVDFFSLSATFPRYHDYLQSSERVWSAISFKMTNDASRREASLSLSLSLCGYSVNAASDNSMPHPLLKDSRFSQR